MFWERLNPRSESWSFKATALPSDRCTNTFRSTWLSRYGQDVGAVRKNCGEDGGWWVMASFARALAVTRLPREPERTEQHTLDPGQQDQDQRDDHHHEQDHRQDEVRVEQSL